MTNQEIFERLSENEMNLFYAYCSAKGSESEESLKLAHEAAKKSLIDFSKATNCKN